MKELNGEDHSADIELRLCSIQEIDNSDRVVELNAFDVF